MDTDSEYPNIVTSKSLRSGGWRPLTVRWRAEAFTHDLYGLCMDFDVLGDVPELPGLYSFVISATDRDRVMYVGRTSHLWMTTKGRLPNGQARGGQRYGRPRHAGITRQRINHELATSRSSGQLVAMWVLPDADSPAALAAHEEAHISGWGVRSHGWNRG
jgi:hypothetical protein